MIRVVSFVWVDIVHDQICIGFYFELVKVPFYVQPEPMLLKNPTGLKQWPTLTAQKSVCIIQCDSSSEWEDDTVEFFQPPPPPFPKIVFPEGSFHNRFQIFHTLKNQDSWAQLLIPSFSWRLYDKLEIVQHFLIQLLLQTSSMQTKKFVNSNRSFLHYYV